MSPWVHSLESFCKSMSLCNFWLIFGNIACQPYMNDRKGSTNCLVELVIASDVFLFYFLRHLLVELVGLTTLKFYSEPSIKIHQWFH